MDVSLLALDGATAEALCRPGRSTWRSRWRANCPSRAPLVEGRPTRDSTSIVYVEPRLKARAEGTAIDDYVLELAGDKPTDGKGER